MSNAQPHIDSADINTNSVHSPLKVLFAAGGTGGHVYPAISIADAVRKLRSDSKILFVGTRDRMEWQAVPGAGYNIKSVWISGFHRRLTPQNLLFPFKLVVSLVQSFSILKRFRPNIIVACGGFAAGPVGWVGAKMGIPLVIQEQNSFPGATNRILAKQAVRIFTAFENARNYLPEDKIELTGNPVRSSLSVSDKKAGLDHFGLSDDQPVLLILGGSGGARAINDAVEKHLDDLIHRSGIQVIWQCGKKYYDDIKKRVDADRYPGLILLAYIDDMAAAYGAATLVMTRAGASTCSELMMIGQPSVLIPSPNVAGDHQTKNAESMVENGAARLVTENELEASLTDLIPALITNDSELKTMSKAAKSLAKPNSSSVIASQLLELATGNHS